MPRQTTDNKLWVIKIILLIVCYTLSFSSFAGDWKLLAPGVNYQDLGSSLLNPWSHIHVFKIDPKKNQFDILLAQDLSKNYASADEFSHHSKGLITLNGGFFDRKFHPLGLRISQSKQKNPLKKISWWGVFYIKNNVPHLATHRQFRWVKGASFALQSGPRLIINKKIPSLKPGVAERSALGITSDNQIIILVTDNAPLSTTDLAKLMRASPLNCKDALNLDGGSSTQLSAHFKTLDISVHGFSKVSDAIIVKPQS